MAAGLLSSVSSLLSTLLPLECETEHHVELGKTIITYLGLQEWRGAGSQILG